MSLMARNTLAAVLLLSLSTSASAATPVSCPTQPRDPAAVAAWAADTSLAIDQGDALTTQARWSELPELARCLDAPVDPAVFAQVIWFHAVSLYNRGDPAWRDEAASVAWAGVPLATLPGPAEMKVTPATSTPTPWSAPTPDVRCWANGAPLTDTWHDEGPKLVQCTRGAEIDGRWLLSGPFPPDLFPAPTPQLPLQRPAPQVHAAPWLHIGASGLLGAYRLAWEPPAGGDAYPVPLNIGAERAGALTGGARGVLRLTPPKLPWLLLTASTQAAVYTFGFPGVEKKTLDAVWQGDLALVGRYAAIRERSFIAWGLRAGMRVDEVGWFAGTTDDLELRDAVRVGFDLGIDAEIEAGRLLVLADVHGWPAYARRGYAVDASATLGVRLTGPLVLTAGAWWGARADDPGRIGDTTPVITVRDTSLSGSIGLALRPQANPRLEPRP